MKINNAITTHGALGGLTANNHHNEAHNLDTHAVRTHANLTGVTADLHHGQTHTSSDHTLDNVLYARARLFGH